MDMPVIEVPEEQRKWIMCKGHDWTAAPNEYLSANPTMYCRRCGIPQSKHHRGSIGKVKYEVTWKT